MSQSLFKSINQKMSSPQNQKSLDILAEFSRYHMMTGHYFSKSKLLHDLKLTQSQFTDLMTGETSIPVSKYNQVIKYMKSFNEPLMSQNKK